MREGARVVYLLDGLDEYGYEDQDLLQQLTHEAPPSLRIVVTARSSHYAQHAQT